MAICATCGDETESDSRVCALCSAAPGPKCSACDTQLPATAKFCPECGTAVSPATRNEPERRILTLVEVDVQGSTPLSGRLDPEDYSAVIGTFHKDFGDAIQGAGGHVLKLMGDGVLAHFGYPTAHEDDARRAVRAALEVIKRTEAAGQLVVRAAVHTGLVLVRDSSSGTTTHVADVFGEAPALVARLQQEAPANGLVITEATRRLVGRYFAIEPLGTRELKGVGAVQVFCVVREAPGDATETPTPFVGREAEMAVLDSAWMAATRGRSQVIVLSGEPGIGKSRLLREFFAHRSIQAHVIQCSEADAARQYAPIARAVQRRLGDEDNSATEEALRAGFQAAGLSLESREARALSDYFGLKSSAPGNPEMLPERAASALEDGLLALLPANANGARLVAVEDLQWADAGTARLVDRLVDGASDQPGLFIICAVRSGFAVPWNANERVRTVSLRRLEPEAIRELLSAFELDQMDEGLVDGIVESSSGIPLFAEELARFLKARGTGETAAKDQLLSLPGSLVELITARLDQLTTERSLLRICAVVGQDISLSLLQELEPNRAVESELDSLERAGILVTRSNWPEETFAFRHDLYRFVAYHMLARPQRIRLHDRVAEAFSQRDEPGTRGRHLMAATRYLEAFHEFREAYKRASSRDLWSESLAWWNQASEAAVAGKLNGPGVADHHLDAVQLAFNDVLDWAVLRPHAEEGLRLHEQHGHPGGIIRAHLALGASYASSRHIEHIDSAAAMRHFSAAREFVNQIGSNSLLVQVETFESNAHRLAGDVAGERRAAEAAYALANETGRPHLVAVASMTYGITLLSAGEINAGMSLMRETWDALRQGHDPFSAGTSHTILVQLTEALFALGRPRDCLPSLEVEIGQDRHGTLHMEQLRLLNAICRLRLGLEVAPVVVSNDLGQVEPQLSLLWLAWNGHYEIALDIANKRIDALTKVGAFYIAAVHRSFLVWAHLSCGRYEEAREDAARVGDQLRATPLYGAMVRIMGAVAAAATGATATAREHLAAFPTASEVLEGGLEGWRLLAHACILGAEGDDAEGEVELAGARLVFRSFGLSFDEHLAERIYRDISRTVAA